MGLKRKAFVLGIIFLMFWALFLPCLYSLELRISSEEIEWIGERIFENECGAQEEYLLQWNEGEDFLSLGIGHFIWYPEGRKEIFNESFPDFLDYAKASNAGIPEWLNRDSSVACPWNSRDDFLSNNQGAKACDLRLFLSDTKSLQANYIVKQFEKNLPLVLENAPEEKRQQVSMNLKDMTSTSCGIYILVDYANFKGLGVLPEERYQNEGWGLLQVLIEMKDEQAAKDIIREFVAAATEVLNRRVRNAPEWRNEQRWLAGWHNRINSYLKWSF